MRLLASLPDPEAPELADFLASLAARGRSPRTARVYAIACRAAAAFARARLTRATRADLLGWLESMTRGGLSAATRANYLSGVREFLAWAVDTGLRPDDPMRGCKQFEIRRKDVVSRRRWKGLLDVTRDEILAECDARITRAVTLRDEAFAHRDRALLLVLADGALRAEECASLMVGDFDPTGRVLAFVGKGGKSRGVPLTARASSALSSWLALRSRALAPGARDARELSETAGPLFLTRAGTRLYGNKAVERIVEDVSRAANPSEHVHPHAFRHSRANELLQGKDGREGADIRDVQNFLGHSDPSTTMGYMDRSGRGLAKRLHERGVL